MLESDLNPWYDKAEASSHPTAICQPGQNGTHRFFSSRFVSRGNATNDSGAFLSWCGDNWIWGSEFLFETTASATVGRGIAIKGPASRMHLYGSNIRVEAIDSTEATGSVTAIRVTDGAELHVHATGIDTIGKPGWTVTALTASTGGFIHANQSSYVLKPATGATVRRIVNNGGTIRAPYLWEEGTPPDIASVNGSDMVVTTDNADNQPHLVLYSDNCPSKWFDTVTGACR